MPKFDITKLNVATDRSLEVTDNPRHRFLLLAYSRHRYLENAGRKKLGKNIRFLTSGPYFQSSSRVDGSASLIGCSPGDRSF